MIKEVRWEQSTNDEDDNQIAGGEIWSILPSKEEFSDTKKKILHQKSTASGNIKCLHHRIEELFVDMWVLRHKRWTDTVQAGWWNWIKSSERCAAMEGIKSQLRESYWDMQSRWSYKEATVTDASRERKCKDK